MFWSIICHNDDKDYSAGIQRIDRIPTDLESPGESDILLVVGKNATYHKRRVFYFYFYEILVDSTLATRRIDEQKINFYVYSLLAPPTSYVASEVMETFCVFVQIQFWYEWYCSFILFSFS